MVIIVFAVLHLHISIVVHKLIFWRASAWIASNEGTVSRCVFVLCGSSLTLKRCQTAIVPQSKLTRSRVRIGKGQRAQSVQTDWYRSEEVGARDQSKDFFVYFITESNPYYLYNLTYRNVDNLYLFFRENTPLLIWNKLGIPSSWYKVILTTCPYKPCS